MLAFRNLNTVGHARSLLQARDLDDVQLSHLDPLTQGVGRSLDAVDVRSFWSVRRRNSTTAKA
jgi:malonyl-CoA reductase/3-hydroxypropionate dehydrogenase (NADP+)